MANCCICKRMLSSENPKTISINGEHKIVCDECKYNYDNISDVGVPNWKITNYFNTRLKTSDPNIRSFLKMKLPDITPIKLPEITSTDKTVESTDYNTINVTDISFWITGLKLLLWIIFFAIIIAGFILASDIDDWIGGIIFLLSIVVAFLTVAKGMVSLNTAADISKIRQMMENRK